LQFADVHAVAGTTTVVVDSAVSFPLDVAVIAAFASVSQLLLMSMPAVSLHDSHSLKHNLVIKIT
jgi:hypothetical protein